MSARSRLVALTLVVAAAAFVFGLAEAAQTGGTGVRNVTAIAEWTAPAGRLDVPESISLGFGERAALVWWRDASSWFPVWRVSVVTEPGLIRADGRGVERKDGHDWLHLASTVEPSAGHTYELTLTYESVQGALGLRVVDRSSGSVVADFGLAALPAVAMPGATGTVQGPRGTEQLTVAEQGGYVPLGVQWAVLRLRGDEPAFQLSDRHPFVEPGDRLWLKIETAGPTSGTWRVRLERAGVSEVLAEVPGSKTRFELPLFTVTEERAGPMDLRLEYLDAGQLTATRRLRLVAGSAQLHLAQPVFNPDLHAATIAARLESTVPLSGSFLVTARLTEVVWNERALRYEEVPVESPPASLRQEVAANPGELVEYVVTVPLPASRGTFKIHYDVEHDFAPQVPVEITHDSRAVNTGYADFEFTAVTYNLWGTNQWPQRSAALEAVLKEMQPDILAVQEFKFQHRETIASALPDHDLVIDLFSGWVFEGNIYWSRERFELVEYGAEDVGICETARRMFWVRLRVKDVEPERTLLVATAHYTWDGHDCIRTHGAGLRVDMARRTLEALAAIRLPGEPVLFMGDLNESGAAIDTLRAGGLRDSVGADGEPLQPTYPADPRTTSYRGILDWQFYSGPIWVVEGGPVDFFLDGVAPSDHKPVLVRYQM